MREIELQGDGFRLNTLCAVMSSDDYCPPSSGVRRSPSQVYPEHLDRGLIKATEGPTKPFTLLTMTDLMNTAPLVRQSRVELGRYTSRAQV